MTSSCLLRNRLYHRSVVWRVRVLYRLRRSSGSARWLRQTGRLLPPVSSDWYKAVLDRDRLVRWMGLFPLRTCSPFPLLLPVRWLLSPCHAAGWRSLLPDSGRVRRLCLPLFPCIASFSAELPHASDGLRWSRLSEWWLSSDERWSWFRHPVLCGLFRGESVRLHFPLRWRLLCRQPLPLLCNLLGCSRHWPVWGMCWSHEVPLLPFSPEVRGLFRFLPSGCKVGWDSPSFRNPLRWQAPR